MQMHTKRPSGNSLIKFVENNLHLPLLNISSYDKHILCTKPQTEQ